MAMWLYITRSKHRRRRLEGHPIQVRHKQDLGADLSFYYSRLLYCLDHMLAVMVLSQHRVLSFKTVRLRAPYSVRCMGHVIKTWSDVCSGTPHS